MDGSRFTEHLRAIVACTDKPAQTLAELCVEDLYLARACLDRIPRAAEQLERRLRPAVSTVLKRMGGASDLQDEITQKLLARLLVGTRQRPPALADYQGRSDLTLFIRISARRLALNNRRDSRTRHRLLDRLAREVEPGPAGADQMLSRGKFRKPFREALRGAIAQLAARDRVVLRLHLVGGMSTRRLAAMYKVNQGTISRWLSRARESIWTDVRRDLGDRLALDPGDVDSVLRTVRADDDITLSSILRESRAPE